MEVDK